METLEALTSQTHPLFLTLNTTVGQLFFHMEALLKIVKLKPWMDVVYNVVVVVVCLAYLKP